MLIYMIHQEEKLKMHDLVTISPLNTFSNFFVSNLVTQSK